MRPLLLLLLATSVHSLLLQRVRLNGELFYEQFNKPYPL